MLQTKIKDQCTSVNLRSFLPLYPFLVIFLYSMRVVFLCSVWSQIELNLWRLCKIFLVGFIFDMSVFLQAVLPFLLFLTLAPSRWYQRKGFVLGAILLNFCLIVDFDFTKIAEFLF